MSVEKFSLSLPGYIVTPLTAEADDRGLSLTELIRDILADHVTGRPYMPQEDKDWLRLYRGLSDDVARHAQDIVTEIGFVEDITARAVKRAQQDQTWLDGYKTCIRSGDIFGKDNPLKTSINQNIGYRVRLAVGGEVIKNPKGRAVMGTCKGLVIKSFSKLRKRS